MCSATPASAERPLLGAAAAARVTDLDGQVASDATLGLAVAAVVAVPVTPRWRIAVEPGVRRAGSGKYSLVYAALPVLAHVGYPIGHRWQLRGTAGFMASALARATLFTSDDDGPVGQRIDETVRRWDLGVVAGVGVERPGYFAELRWSRGLATVHAQEPGLFIVNTELGLWIGILR